jgi:hypothetical protein
VNAQTACNEHLSCAVAAALHASALCVCVAECAFACRHTQVLPLPTHDLHQSKFLAVVVAVCACCRLWVSALRSSMWRPCTSTCLHQVRRWGWQQHMHVVHQHAWYGRVCPLVTSSSAAPTQLMHQAQQHEPTSDPPPTHTHACRISHLESASGAAPAQSQ